MAFPMETKIVGLIKNSDENTGYIFGEEKNYVVPEYQRDYSWGEKEIESFVSSLKQAVNGESVFMGTVQFNKKQKNGKSELHIIDGQQRMTTFMLLCNMLEKITGYDIIAKNNMKLDIRNFGSNIDKLNEALKCDEIDGATAQNNRYLENAKLLKNELKELKKSLSEEAKQETECDDFEARVLTAIIDKVYFVELTTDDMKLPEVVGIFNTINTTGLDLNCSDLFKLQYYEYLRENYGDNDWMKKICDVYENVNKKDGRNMSDALDVYKHCIVAKHKLGWTMLSKSNESFFEDVLSNKDYAKSDILQFEEFNNLINIYLYLSDNSDNIQAEPTLSTFAGDIIGKTRYWRYWTIPYVISYFNDGKYNEAQDTALCVSKCLVMYSVVYNKVVTRIQTFMCNEILPAICENKDINEIDGMVKGKIKEWHYDEGDYNVNVFKNRINKNLFFQSTRVRLICVLSALLEEINAKTEISEIRKKLFDWNNFQYDIEHICAIEKYKTNDPQNSSVYNGIGNLVVLNRSINRDIKDADANKKVKKYEDREKYKKEPEFESVKIVAKRIHEAGEKWGIEQVRKRANEETKKLCDFLGLEYSEV